VEATLGYTMGTLALLHPDFEETPTVRDEPEIRRWFQSVLFAKDLANEFGLVTAHALLVHLYVFLGRGGRRDVLYKAIDQRVLVPTLHQLMELVPLLREELDDPAATLRLLRSI
jgi:hypothetical protein